MAKDTKLHNFQLKLLHIMLPCNSYLCICGLNELSMETKKNMLHVFWYCNLVQHFWFYVKNLLKICVITLSLNVMKITLGISRKYFENRNTVNYVLLISKYIYLV
jgi:hypothetical protein